MNTQLKPVSEQVVAIMGASSGIGRETALRFAEHGARVIVAARSEDALRMLENEIVANGGSAHAVVADVSRFDEVKSVAGAAVQQYGGLVTWVHLAAVSVY